MKSLNPLLISILLLDPAGLLAQEEAGTDSDIFAIRGDGIVSHDMFDTKISRIPDEHRLTVIRDRGRLSDILDNLLLQAQLSSAAR